ncbi:response regulator transcription factor [Kribbella sp. HUAS MG21]|uniref:Response regulator transcription factor n=1 Tax=Kribbella sp. HUAS MG21 TaxID=3160966 RepID=A0AAU7T7K7_9ACTN
MPMQVLIVEDDDRIRAVLRLALEDEGYEVAEAADTPSALAEVRSSVPDLMMVDLMLGEVDGYTCIREVRRISDIPIVIVSARSDTHDIVAGLEAGADDYVTKPFQVKEITARLRALRRRLRSSNDPVEADVVLDPDPEHRLVLSTARGAVSLNGKDVPLTVTEYRLLVELAQPPGRVLTRSALLASVWEHGYYGDERIVDVHIRRLRTKIERDPGKPRLVVTMRGMGYRLDPQ